MKKVIALLALCAVSGAFAQASNDIANSGARIDLQTLPVIRNQLGTGTPAPMITVGDETAVYVDDGYYHIPQYLPNHPTAATIWPRVVEVECDKVNGKIVCDGYHWLPKLGRAEYIMIIPKMREKPAPIIVKEPVIVYKEVPVKKKGE